MSLMKFIHRKVKRLKDLDDLWNAIRIFFWCSFCLWAL
ncbi:hypothetical protein OIU79_026227, partial [Salix purpurea]